MKRTITMRHGLAHVCYPGDRILRRGRPYVLPISTYAACIWRGRKDGLGGTHRAIAEVRSRSIDAARDAAQYNARYRQEWLRRVECRFWHPVYVVDSWDNVYVQAGDTMAYSPIDEEFVRWLHGRNLLVFSVKDPAIAQALSRILGVEVPTVDDDGEPILVKRWQFALHAEQFYDIDAHGERFALTLLHEW